MAAFVILRAQHGSSCNGAYLARLLLRLSQWHVECLSLKELTGQIFEKDIRKLFKYWLNLSWDLQLDLWLSFSSHKGVTSQPFIQALLELIGANQVHHFFPLPLLIFFSVVGGLDWFRVNFTFLSLWTNEQWLVRPCMISSKLNNHGRPKMIWSTFIGSISHHMLSVYVANWIGIWLLSWTSWTSMDVASIHVTL